LDFEALMYDDDVRISAFDFWLMMTDIWDLSGSEESFNFVVDLLKLQHRATAGVSKESLK
jgi:hypothetical protein